ncbi:unnamed protein product [Phytomonas sp. EM1]|nr:unnamed protein product [Phytomonas sp. EM1]|eukprot:CCW60673.1 unnamed protein product [Phytomonas sp. isolate EM1]
MNDQELIERILNSSKDYYDVLQVNKDASLSAIRRSYYKLSLKLHPDKNLDNSEEVKKAFQIVSRSYEVLKDSTSRSIYNRFGEEGLMMFENGDHSIRSISEFFFMAVEIALFELILYVARRMGASSFIQHIGLLVGSAREQRGPSIVYSEEWVHFRRRVFNCFVAVISFFLILLSIEPIYGCIYAASSSKHHLDASAMLDPSSFFYPPKGSQKHLHQAEPLSIYASCLAEADPRSFLACHERLALSEGSQEGWLVGRYAGSDEAARAAFYAFMVEECDSEALFLWASRERFKQTATLCHKAPPLSVKNPNRLPKRKYPEKRWHSKFHESFSVASAEELFHPLTFCEQLWRQKSLVSVI